MEMKSRGVISRITEQGGTTLIGFFEHDGYFSLRDPALLPALRAAHDSRAEIVVMHDRDLVISSFSDRRADVAGVEAELSPFAPSPKG